MAGVCGGWIYREKTTHTRHRYGHHEAMADVLDDETKKKRKKKRENDSTVDNQPLNSD
jgi:hypothetical protein